MFINLIKSNVIRFSAWVPRYSLSVCNRGHMALAMFSESTTQRFANRMNINDVSDITVIFEN